MMVPADQVAKVIGKGGAGLKQIRESTGCKLQVEQIGEDPAQPTRRVDVTGSPGQVAAAAQLIAGKAFVNQDVPYSIYIPAEKAGQVVGRGGDNLRRAREMCHARLALERDPVTNAATGQQERLLTVQGEPAQVSMAVRCALGAGSPFGAPGPTGAPQAAGLVGVRAPSADPEELHLHFAVPAGLAGAIIGKGGAQVKQTAAETGARITMSSREGGGDRRAVIVGSYGVCVAAQQAIYRQVAEAAQAAGQAYSEVSVVYMVRREAAGAVIGKQGSGLKQIRETSGARVQLAQEEMEGQRPCSISGSFEGVMQAEKLIFELSLGTLMKLGGAGGAVAPPDPAAVPTGVAAAWQR